VGLLDRSPEIDVSEHGTVVYYWVDGEPKPVPEDRNCTSWSRKTSTW
jgi:hypothetical protein